jgi:hypothetical protein
MPGSEQAGGGSERPAHEEEPSLIESSPMARGPESSSWTVVADSPYLPYLVAVACVAATAGAWLLVRWKRARDSQAAMAKEMGSSLFGEAGDEGEAPLAFDDKGQLTSGGTGNDPQDGAPEGSDPSAAVDLVRLSFRDICALYLTDQRAGGRMDGWTAGPVD